VADDRDERAGREHLARGSAAAGEIERARGEEESRIGRGRVGGGEGALGRGAGRTDRVRIPLEGGASSQHGWAA
jgi:hypothetical protein